MVVLTKYYLVLKSSSRNYASNDSNIVIRLYAPSIAKQT